MLLHSDRGGWDNGGIVVNLEKQKRLLKNKKKIPPGTEYDFPQAEDKK
jgi:hypothetical protein